MCHILSCCFWSVYDVFSDFADVLDAPFLLEEALIYCCVVGLVGWLVVLGLTAL